MANEITITTSLAVAKGSLNDKQTDRFTATFSGTLYASAIVSVGFSTHQALATTTIATPGFLYVKNLDATNYVDIGKDSSGTFVPFARIKPGESQLFRPSTSALYAKASTAAVKLQFKLYED